MWVEEKEVIGEINYIPAAGCLHPSAPYATLSFVANCQCRFLSCMHSLPFPILQQLHQCIPFELRCRRMCMKKWWFILFSRSETGCVYCLHQMPMILLANLQSSLISQGEIALIDILLLNQKMISFSRNHLDMRCVLITTRLVVHPNRLGVSSLPILFLLHLPIWHSCSSSALFIRYR